jgi:hypothetical protein
MNSKFIYFISFLLGLFISLSLFTFHNKFFYVNKNLKIENFYSGYSYNIENFDTVSTTQPSDTTLPTDTPSETTSTNTTLPIDTPSKTTSTNTTISETTSTNTTKTLDTSDMSVKTNEKDTTDIALDTVENTEIIKSATVSIPKKSLKFISISTYYNNIINSEQKWYDDDIDIKTISSMSFNEGTHFVYNTPLDFYKNDKTNIIKGAIINKVQLKGPNALYFANNYDKKNYELTSFSIFFMLKINNIVDNMTLFEMLANTSVIETDTQQVNYIPNSISINIKINKTGNFDIELIIGNSKYNITNIDKKILIGTDINLIGLIFDGVNIKLIINNNKYSFKYTELEIITLGSSPIIINKEGTLDGFLYSFIYYKTALTEDEIVLLKTYNNYYIFGLYQTDENKVLMENSLKTLQGDLNDKDALILKLTEDLNKCANNTESLLSYKQLEIPKIEEVKTPLPSLYESVMPTFANISQYIF